MKYLKKFNEELYLHEIEKLIEDSIDFDLVENVQDIFEGYNENLYYNIDMSAVVTSKDDKDIYIYDFNTKLECGCIGKCNIKAHQEGTYRVHTSFTKGVIGFHDKKDIKVIIDEIKYKNIYYYLNLSSRICDEEGNFIHTYHENKEEYTEILNKMCDRIIKFGYRCEVKYASLIIQK